MTSDSHVVGVGAPVVDYLVQVSEAFVASIPGEKGGMELVDAATMARLIERIGADPVRAPGGSAANTVLALARLGIKTSFLGKLGWDENGRFYQEAFRNAGGDPCRLRMVKDLPTACCLSLVTPDSERTMRTHLGAAALRPEEVSSKDFAGCSHAHIEGYLLFDRDLTQAVLSAAKRAGCTISLDLASFEVVRMSRDILPWLLEEYVDMAFANEAEAEALTGESDPARALDVLSRWCPIAAVKLGKNGTWLRRDREKVRVHAAPTPRVVDTTGAGDLWAAGFLFGHLTGQSLKICGDYASILGSEAVQRLGAVIPEEDWPAVRARIDRAAAVREPPSPSSDYS